MFPHIIANRPEHLGYLDRDDPNPDGTLPQKPSRIILSGGEALLEAVRERVTYRVIDAPQEKHRGQGV